MSGVEPAEVAPLDEPVDDSSPLADAAADSWGLRRARRRSVWLGVGLLLVSVVLTASLVSEVRHPWFQPFDDSVRAWSFDHRSGGATDLAKLLSVMGSSWVSFPVRLGVSVLLLVRRRWTQLAAFIVAILASEVAIGTLKHVVGRERPGGSLVTTTGMSFPSGHAIAGAVTAFGIVAALLPRGRRRWHWFVAASAFAAFMSWSRVYLSAHWATDTIAGTAIGVALAILAEALFEGGRTAVASGADPAAAASAASPSGGGGAAR
jgi:undecaprenyl-diphosphatase